MPTFLSKRPGVGERDLTVLFSNFYSSSTPVITVFITRQQALELYTQENLENNVCFLRKSGKSYNGGSLI